MAVCSISIVPLGQGTSISEALAKCLRALDAFKDLKYRLTAMSTHIEGPLDRIFPAVRAMHEAAAATGAGRIYTTITIDDRRDKEVTLNGKVAAVQKKLDK